MFNRLEEAQKKNKKSWRDRRNKKSWRQTKNNT
jgi:hypothetical protein